MMDNVDPYLRAKMTPGSLWRHPKSDRIYELLHLARTESHCEEVVVYRPAGAAHGYVSVWVRPLVEFAGRFREEPEPVTPRSEERAAPHPLDARALKKRLEDRDVIIGVLRERCQLLETLVPLVRELLGERSFTTSEEPLFPRMKKVLADIDAPPKGAPSA